MGQKLGSEGCLLSLKRISACGFHEKNSIKISDLKNNNNNRNFIIPTISALNHISTLALTNQEEINFWQTGRLIEFKFDNFAQSFKFNDEDPIKIIDKEDNLLGIGFLNKEKTKLHPKLVLNAK